jgi:hypothetical protein
MPPPSLSPPTPCPVGPRLWGLHAVRGLVSCGLTSCRRRGFHVASRFELICRCAQGLRLWLSRSAAYGCEPTARRRWRRFPPGLFLYLRQNARAQNPELACMQATFAAASPGALRKCFHTRRCMFTFRCPPRSSSALMISPIGSKIAPAVASSSRETAARGAGTDCARPDRSCLPRRIGSSIPCRKTPAPHRRVFRRTRVRAKHHLSTRKSSFLAPALIAAVSHHGWAPLGPRLLPGSSTIIPRRCHLRMLDCHLGLGKRSLLE